MAATALHSRTAPRRIARVSLAASLAVATVTTAVAAVAPGADPLGAAAAALAGGDVAATLDLLERAFAAGHPTPSDAYADPRFAALRATTDSRRRFRELMARHVRESEMTIVPPDEPGRRMRVEGQVVRAPDGAPVAGAVLELYHTDATGHYEPGQTVGRDRTSRLFGFVASDERGRFVVHTIQPAPYPGASPGAAHVHFRISAAGYRPYSHDFRPYDHPRDPGQRATAVARGERFSTVVDEGPTLVCRVTIPMTPAASSGPR